MQGFGWNVNAAWMRWYASPLAPRAVSLPWIYGCFLTPHDPIATWLFPIGHSSAACGQRHPHQLIDAADSPPLLTNCHCWLPTSCYGIPLNPVSTPDPDDPLSPELNIMVETYRMPMTGRSVVFRKLMYKKCGKHWWMVQVSLQSNIPRSVLHLKPTSVRSQGHVRHPYTRWHVQSSSFELEWRRLFPIHLEYCCVWLQWQWILQWGISPMSFVLHSIQVQSYSLLFAPELCGCKIHSIFVGSICSITLLFSANIANRNVRGFI